MNQSNHHLGIPVDPFHRIPDTPDAETIHLLRTVACTTADLFHFSHHHPTIFHRMQVEIMTILVEEEQVMMIDIGGTLKTGEILTIEDATAIGLCLLPMIDGEHEEVVVITILRILFPLRMIVMIDVGQVDRVQFLTETGGTSEKKTNIIIGGIIPKTTHIVANIVVDVVGVEKTEEKENDDVGLAAVGETTTPHEDAVDEQATAATMKNTKTIKPVTQQDEEGAWKITGRQMSSPRKQSLLPLPLS